MGQTLRCYTKVVCGEKFLYICEELRAIFPCRIYSGISRGCTNGFKTSFIRNKSLGSKINWLWRGKNSGLAL